MTWPAWVLLAVSLSVVVLAAGTRRRGGPRALTRDGYLARWSELHGGYDPGRSVWVRGYLIAVYAVAGPLARVGVRPGVVTMAGPVAAGAAAYLATLGPGPRIGAAAVVIASALLDGLDGGLAVIGSSDSRVGYVLDSVADRLADGLWLVALWAAGAPAGVAVGAAATVVLLEYTRARSAGAGLQGVGVVTVAERPTRVIGAAIGLLAAGVVGTGVFGHAGPLSAGNSVDWADAAAAALTAAGVAGLAQLWRVVVATLGSGRADEAVDDRR